MSDALKDNYTLPVNKYGYVDITEEFPEGWCISKLNERELKKLEIPYYKTRHNVYAGVSIIIPEEFREKERNYRMEYEKWLDQRVESQWKEYHNICDLLKYNSRWNEFVEYLEEDKSINDLIDDEDIGIKVLFFACEKDSLGYFCEVERLNIYSNYCVDASYIKSQDEAFAKKLEDEEYDYLSLDDGCSFDDYALYDYYGFIRQYFKEYVDPILGTIYHSEESDLDYSELNYMDRFFALHDIKKEDMILAIPVGMPYTWELSEEEEKEFEKWYHD